MSPTPRGARGVASRRFAAAGTGAVLMALTAGGIAAGSFLAPAAEPREIGVPASTVPAGDFVAQCPPSARLVQGAGTEGTDPAFAAGSDSAKTSVRASVLSDAAERAPGARIVNSEGETLREVNPTIADESAEREATSGSDGLSGQSASTVSGLSAAGAAVLRVQPLGGLKSVAGMARSYSASDGDLAGLAVSGCQSPANEQWLVGASTQVGRTALLVVSNPSANTSTVDLDLFSSKGRVEAGNTRGLVLAAGESRSIVLGGLAPNDPAVSVRVSATGAPVTAVVQQSVLRGLTSGGVDYIEPSARAGQTQVVPAVAIQDPADTKDIASQRGYSDATPELEVAVPGDDEAVLNIRALGASGEVALPDGGVHTAPGGGTARIPLGSLPKGDYTIVVESDQPIAAGARVVRGSAKGKPVDVAWSAAADRLGNQHLLVVPELAAGRLAFGSIGGDAAVSLRPVSKDGSIGREKILSPAGGTTAVQQVGGLGPDVVAVIVSASGEPVYGGQVLTSGSAAVSTIGIPPATEGQRGINVDIRY